MDGRGPCSIKGLSLRTAQVNDLNCFMKTKLLLSTAAFVTGVLVGGCKGKSHTTSPAPPLVEVVTVTQADVPHYHAWICVPEGLVNAHIRAQVTG